MGYSVLMPYIFYFTLIQNNELDTEGGGGCWGGKQIDFRRDSRERGALNVSGNHLSFM